MTVSVPTRQSALGLLKKYNESESLIKHAYAVEGVMRFMAKKAGEDEEKWGIIGLIHDLDYEMYPAQHCIMTEKILLENNWPPEYIRAVMSHGWGLVTEVEPLSKLEKTIYAMDELTGLVATSALVRPSKSVLDMEARSVKKKWNDKRFAAGVDRSVIEKGAEMLGVSLDDMINDCIMGMRTVAEEIGLKGNPV
ncbi:MAG: hydrolase [Bacteroidetes bacterium GWE2_41_25]|nr:MAG: hydrolase [Bacteroidetes bacterium GWA2_40_15]OFX96740.1 MAG: hydrolase [Bacteroidetes bacterium GWC2_40_22]OFY12259.1 MAG: hydrolase [Bacteroidetes bacterium GWE2_41_25]HBH85435.1 hydrolase [Bacteroidales bacterium]HBQ83572.1 hydrolase [Bacteroidales bacterium]